MTKQAKTETDQSDRNSYNVALELKNRCVSFFVLIESTLENYCGFDEEEIDAIVQTARDVADTARECFQLVRKEHLIREGIDP